MKLRSLLENRPRLLSEIEAAKQLKEISTQQVSAAVRSGNVEKELDKLGKIATRSGLIPERLAQLNLELTTVEEEISDQLRDDVRRWNSFVKNKADATFDRFIVAVNPFFGGVEKERLTRRDFARQHIPAVSETQRAFFELGDYRRIRAEQRIALAQRFLSHCQEQCRLFGWDEREAESFVEQRPAASEATLKKIKVRVLNDVTLPALNLKNTKKAPKMSLASLGEYPDRLLQAGEELEIEEAQYNALARFFEKL
ncbi:MAG TPA: hypothetical protein VKY92_07515 [Verrucomicrobiae bacterium]|nr:hypothetical protein [Verrucomicrobiae bacterium]